MTHLSDIEIARQAELKPIEAIAENVGIPPGELIPYGRDKAKLSGDVVARSTAAPRGKLILVTAMSPTPAGEGKTTTTVGLGDGMARIGRKAMICLREPSLGPCFGMKGGAAGGGYAQVVPMADINLHFTGDIHAIGAAHNLLAALVDNHVHWDNALDIDPRRVSWGRVVDMNDRALRSIAVGLGGPANGVVRESGYDITVASEVMAILCLASDFRDLEERLSRIVVAQNRSREPVTVGDLNAQGAMAVLLKDAFMPNLVQTLEHNPALMHGGPFANIAHGCNSVVATRTALGLADYVITEAGFGADLGAEKFFNIKCRKAGLAPQAAVVVATVRALKMHGGVARADLNQPNVDAVLAGASNLGRHLDNIGRFGVPAVVAINRFGSDTEAELEAVHAFCRDRSVPSVTCTHWADGGAGAQALAEAVVELADSGQAKFQPLYGDDESLWSKVERVARDIYGAAEVSASKAVRQQLEAYESAGYGHLPVCMAKTQYSFSTDRTLLGAPEGHTVEIRELRLSAGAGFVVAICGSTMTMPGLPRTPAALAIHLDESGDIQGLF